MIRAIELSNAWDRCCRGPFDDPEAVAARFALLCDGGAGPGRFHGVELPRVSRERRAGPVWQAGRCGCLTRRGFFNDHFEAARISATRCSLPRKSTSRCGWPPSRRIGPHRPLSPVRHD
jgi:hypothetical protein